MITPNGRFAVNTRLCVSMSDFHPETWNPVSAGALARVQSAFDMCGYVLRVYSHCFS